MLTYLLDQTDARCGWSTIVDRNLALEPVSPEEDMAAIWTSYTASRQ
jgi:hypothetical protein